MKGQFGFFSRAKKRTKRKKEYFSQQAEIFSNLRPRCNARQYLAEQKVKVSLDEDLNLLPELGLDFGLSGSAQVGRALGDATEGEGVAFGRDLLGKLGRLLVDGVAGVLLGGGVAAVVQLVVGGVEGEGLHHVGSGAEELAVESEN